MPTAMRRKAAPGVCEGRHPSCAGVAWAVGRDGRHAGLAWVVVGGLDGLGVAGGQVVLAEHEDHPSEWK